MTNKTVLPKALTAFARYIEMTFQGAGLRARRNRLGPLMTSRILLIVVLLFAFADPALANWWIARASDETCLVVDIEPRGNDRAITKALSE